MRKVQYPVAVEDEIIPDKGKTVPLGPDGGECTLFHHAGRYYAVGSLCPHQNAPLNGAPAQNGEVICLRHGYRFDLKTGDCITLGGYGLPVYPIHKEGNQLIVSVWEYE